MSYDKAARMHASASAAQSLTSTADLAPTFIVDRPCQVNQIGFKVTTTLSSTGNTVITVYQRPVYGANTNQVSIGTITIPTGVAAGAIYVNNISDKTGPILNVGDQITFAVTTAASSAGAGVPLIQLDYSPESDKDNANIVVVSA